MKHPKTTNNIIDIDDIVGKYVKEDISAIKPTVRLKNIKSAATLAIIFHI